MTSDDLLATADDRIEEVETSTVEVTRQFELTKAGSAWKIVVDE